MRILKKKDQEAMLKDLGSLLAIQNDYILKEDSDNVVALYQSLALYIDKKNGVEKLMDYAEAAFKIRHPDYFISAEKS